MMRFIIALVSCLLLHAGAAWCATPDTTGHPQAIREQSGIATGSGITIRQTDKIHGFGPGYDPDIYSPKSATFSKDGRKLYINSLEGCKTVVYDAVTHKKLKVISHTFESGEGPLWLEPSGYYPFTHYPGGEGRSFRGKPVEAALSLDGRYLFVPYYRRTFDINAQDPSALAVIDTEKDEIVLMVETGPLPKMVKVSNDGRLLAITHWGDNTVGFLDISESDIRKWHHLPPVTINRKAEPNFSLTEPVNRDANSGYLLRGTVFLPGDSILLVSGMAGPLSAVDVKRGKWVGSFGSLYGIRHITMKGGNLYMSRNSAGEVVIVPTDSIAGAIDLKNPSFSGALKAGGVSRIKAGSGARTLKVSPSGRYVFVACNFSSDIVVVDSRLKKVAGRIEADPYPVGLDISPDGRMLVSTSQGRNGIGGNAVNFFEIEYSEPETVFEESLPTVTNDSTITNDTVPSSSVPSSASAKGSFGAPAAIAIAIGILAIFIFLFTAKRHHRTRN